MTIVSSTDLDATDFEAERSRLTAIAARILGSESEADDVLQEAWLRLARTDGVDNLPAWLTTVVTRLCLDHLRKRNARTNAEAEAAAESKRSGEHTTGVDDPETDALLAEQVAGAMQVVLDVLSPAERVALVLHDAFDYPFDEISAILGRSGTAVRQLASRARRKAQAAPEPAAEQTMRAEHGHVVDAFLTAAHGGDLATLLALLAPDAVMHADMAGQKMGTDALYDGPDAVAARFNGVKGAAPVTIDGELGGAWIMAGTVKVAFLFHVDDGRVKEVELIADPEILETMDVTRVR